MSKARHLVTRQRSDPPHDTGPESPARVLVVGDEGVTATLLATALHYDGWKVEMADSFAAEVASGRFAPHVLLLDHTDATVLEGLRAQRPGIPALLLSDPEAVADTDALGDGTDQLTSLLPLSALCARLRRLLLGSGGRTRAADLVVGDLVLHADGVTARHRDELIELTPGQWLLLNSLMRHPGAVLTRAQITARLWQHDFGGGIDVVDLYVECLRDKIDLPGVPRIVRVGPDGYALVPRGER